MRWSRSCRARSAESFAPRTRTAPSRRRAASPAARRRHREPSRASGSNGHGARGGTARRTRRTGSRRRNESPPSCHGTALGDKLLDAWGNALSLMRRILGSEDHFVPRAPAALDLKAAPRADDSELLITPANTRKEAYRAALPRHSKGRNSRVRPEGGRTAAVCGSGRLKSSPPRALLAALSRGAADAFEMRGVARKQVSAIS